MAKTVGIGIQSFDKLIKGNYFYVDKTAFIKEWWESGDDVTLITRPRRFGKTLNMSMLEEFFSVNYADRGDLFEGLSIWEEEKYRELQGTYPVISLSFAAVKEKDYATTVYRICQFLMKQYEKYGFLRESDLLSGAEKNFFEKMASGMNEEDAPVALYQLSDFLQRYYGKKVIILLDEYDTPIQEAYVNGFWNELVSFTRSLFNSTFKTNPYLERALLTGITRVSKESIFSDLNNLDVVTTTSDKYATSFGFTEEEVFTSLEEFGMSDMRGQVKEWYDGFTFGKHTDIYNPWSITQLLDKGKLGLYWVNTSSNGLINRLVQTGSSEMKQEMERLLKGEGVKTEIEEQVVYGELDVSETAVWSLMLASGYLTAAAHRFVEESGTDIYTLKITNKEVRVMFEKMFRGWFEHPAAGYNHFIKALLAGNLEDMNDYMNDISLVTFSSFDTGTHPSKGADPENFYHGFVLGLIVEQRDNYVVTSNRESGRGRYDIMMEPRREELPAIVMEFKVYHPRKEKNLEETVEAALAQIREKDYDAVLLEKGIKKERIRHYGFAFEGKTVLIGTDEE